MGSMGSTWLQARGFPYMAWQWCNILFSYILKYVQKWDGTEQYKKHRKKQCKISVLLHFRPPPPFCYWWLTMIKHGWKLCHSHNPNPRGVRKCNSAKISESMMRYIFSKVKGYRQCTWPKENPADVPKKHSTHWEPT